MGIFDNVSDLFGELINSDQDSEQVANSNVKETSREGTTGLTLNSQSRGLTQEAGTKRGTEAGQSETISLFSNQDLGILSALTKTLAGNQARAAGQQSGVVDDIVSRAAGQGAPLGDQDIAAILGDAERGLTRTLRRDVTSAATNAGSALNTFVGDVGARGAADLQTQLAALGANLRLQRDASDRQARTEAVEATEGRTSELLAALQQSRGGVAQAEQTSFESLEQQETTNQMIELVNEILNSSETTRNLNRDTSGGVVASEESTPGLLDVLALFK